MWRLTRIKNMKNYQHPPLRKPKNWKDEEAALVMQLERLLDDIYRQLGQIKERLKELESEE